MNPVISILEVSKLQLFKFRDSNMYIGLRKPQQNDLRLIASGEILKLFSLLIFVYSILKILILPLHLILSITQKLCYTIIIIVLKRQNW
jgi:hypothetical protein